VVVLRTSSARDSSVTEGGAEPPGRRPGARRPDAAAAAARGLFWLASAIIPLAIFGAFFHWQILIPTRVNWLLQGDWGAHVLGWNAFRHDDWRWPLGMTRLLAWPLGAAVSYTDSNPLICLLLKPFSGLLPTPFQFTGPWLLSCILLQFWAAYLLLRPHVTGRWPGLAGATLFTLTPTLLNRLGHADLCAHWTILLSLHAFVNVRSEARRDLLYAALLTVSALVHPYLLLMNAAVWASDVLRRAVGALRSGAFGELALLTARSAAVAALPLAALWATGALGGYQGQTDGFGYYSMALDALFNPGTAGYSRFLPVAPQGPGQVFEGFQYLGAGLLALVVAAAAVLVRPEGRAAGRTMGWLAWLAPALFVLFALALSDHIQMHGRVVGRLSYDWIPFHITSTFRSSGRLFWPCAYVLILVALMLVFSLRPAWALAIALAAVVLQVADLTGFAPAIRAFTADAAGPQRYARMTSRKWEPLIASADLVEFQAPDPHADLVAFYEIAWRAVSMRRPVNVMYTARANPQQKALDGAGRSAFLTGRLDPRRLYVVLDGCLPAGIDASRLKMVNQLPVIPPANGRYPFVMRPAPATEPFPIGRTVSPTADAPQFRCMFGKDWSGIEGWGVWSDGAAPELILRLAEPPGQDLLFSFAAHAFPTSGQGVTVIAGGRPVGHVALSGEPAEYRLRVPRSAAAGPLLDLVFKVDRPQSPPRAQGRSSDARLLGIGLISARLDPAPDVVPSRVPDTEQ
jgi:hypothetical protein